MKGGDYTNEEVVWREFAGEVRIVSLLEGRGSSELLQRLDAALSGNNSVLK